MSVTGHDCIHAQLPPLASQRSAQRYAPPEKATATNGNADAALPLRIFVSADSLSSDPDKACFAAGDRYAPFTGSSSSTCTALDVITDAKRTMLLETLMPEATAAFSSLLRVQRVQGPLVLQSMRCGYGGGVPVPGAHRTAGVDADFVIYITARPIDVGGETIAYSGHCEQDQHGRPIAAHFNWSPRHLPAVADAWTTRYLVRVAMHELTHALVFSAPLLAARKAARPLLGQLSP